MFVVDVFALILLLTFLLKALQPLIALPSCAVRETNKVETPVAHINKSQKHFFDILSFHTLTPPRSFPSILGEEDLGLAGAPGSDDLAVTVHGNGEKDTECAYT